MGNQVEIPMMSIQLGTSTTIQCDGNRYRLVKPTIIRVPCGLHVMCENENKKKFITKHNFIDSRIRMDINEMKDHIKYYLLNKECTDVPRPSSTNKAILPAQTMIIPKMGEPITLDNDTEVELDRDYEMVILPGSKLQCANDSNQIVLIEMPTKAYLATYCGFYPLCL
jgi:hypothetical protein